MKRLFKGGCHCGAVRFEAVIDTASGSDKCNCSYCSRLRLWSVKISKDDFKLLKGEADITDYRGNNTAAHHTFCRHCGIHSFYWVDVPNMNGAPYYSVNLNCLDDMTVDERVAMPVHYFDGLNDAWERTPVEVRHL